jgi:hypothetical protein
MTDKKSNRGVIVDMEALIAQQGDQPAVGNMGVNANGDVLGPNGEIIQKAEDRVRAYYEENPMSSTAKTTLKGPMPDQPVTEETDAQPELKTAEAQKTEQDQSVMNAVETPAEEERKVISYKEVELPNGDIEMVPVYEDDWTDGDS